MSASPRVFGGVIGSVVVVPAVVLLFGSAWSWGGHTFAHWILLPILWGAFGVLRWIPGPAAPKVLAAWAKADLWLASALVSAVVLRPPPNVWAGLLTVGPILGFVALARRAPAVTALYAAIVWVFVAWLIPSHFSARIIARIAEVHEVSVDHRLVPDGDEINADGLRFRGTAEDLDPDDFVVLFLGDSFTYGLHLDYPDAYPYAFEAFVADGACRRTVRAVNFGWTSSSPLLGLRLLREIGYRYQPDLVVYNLDMTDFHDDLRYARELRQGGGDFSIDGAEIANVALNRVWPGEPLDVRRIFRIPEGPAPPDDELALPEERFFVTLQPLDETRAWIERGVGENLEALSAFTDDVLGSAFAVVVYPRAFQYSRFESPRNWEEEKVERMGPHALEPFRYFDEEAARLPYPVVSLLPAFQTSKRSPLFLTNDPHWTRFGAALAAETVARELGRLGLLPCELPGEAP